MSVGTPPLRRAEFRQGDASAVAVRVGRARADGRLPAYSAARGLGRHLWPLLLSPGTVPDMSGIEVRRLAPQDWQTVRELRLASLADAPKAFTSTWAAEASFTDEQWQQRASARTWFAASVDGTPAGVVCGIPTADPTVRKLISMWVATEHRGSGVAAALVEAVADWARQRGADVLELAVIVGNERASALYRRLGFTLLPGLVTFEGSDAPCQRMRRRLDQGAA